MKNNERKLNNLKYSVCSHDADTYRPLSGPHFLNERNRRVGLVAKEKKLRESARFYSEHLHCLRSKKRTPIASSGQVRDL
jgi:hypothetical protein